MENVNKKLQLKDAHRLLILNAPEDVRKALERSEAHIPLIFSRDYRLPADYVGSKDCVLAFLFEKAHIDSLAAAIKAADADPAGDPLFWFAYPKASSKRYTADFNRDSGWEAILDLGFEGVRQIAFDEDWSLLRFRHRSHIAKYTRKSQIGRS